MPRRPRAAPGGLVYHVLNRAAGRVTLFRTDKDYAAFARTLVQAHARHPIDLFAFCLMPNHWHVVAFMPGNSALVAVKGMDDPKIIETLKKLQDARAHPDRNPYGKPTDNAAAETPKSAK